MVDVNCLDCVIQVRIIEAIKCTSSSCLCICVSVQISKAGIVVLLCISPFTVVRSLRPFDSICLHYLAVAYFIKDWVIRARTTKCLSNNWRSNHFKYPFFENIRINRFLLSLFFITIFVYGFNLKSFIFKIPEFL